MLLVTATLMTRGDVTVMVTAALVTWRSHGGERWDHLYCSSFVTTLIVLRRPGVWFWFDECHCLGSFDKVDIALALQAHIGLLDVVATAFQRSAHGAGLTAG